MYGHYFDIETYSPGEKPDPKKDKIISIQFQKIDLNSAKPVSKLVILKEWEEGEEEIVKIIHKWFFTRPWDFIPIGFNLNFEWKFLSEKFKQYNLENKDLGYYFENFPQIDLKPISVIKKGEFFGASLSLISNKKEDGEVIKEYYEKKEFEKIEKYIIQETESFIEFFQKVKKIIDENF